MEVSVVIVAYNEEACIKKCLAAVLNQSFSEFELLVINDGSTDQTADIINSINDRRIRCIGNDRNYGVAASRNLGLEQANGKYIFFTDADCIPTKYWLENGLRVLKERQFIGVAGKTLYATARATASDRVIEDLTGNARTMNNVYLKEILKKAGGFDPKYNLAYEDQDIGLRIRKYGRILFSEEMLVIHQRKKYSLRKLLSDAKRARDLVYLIKAHPDYRNIDIIWKRVLYPKKLLILLCPFLLLPYHSFRSWQDIKLIPAIYLSAFYLRLIVWKTALKERIFLL